MLISELLARRVGLDGARPLVTWYGPDGDRTELSAVSFANWVNKTSNLLSDTLGLGAGDAVAMPLAAHHPGHWMTLVWYAATWQAGLCVDLGPDTVGSVDVVGPELDLTAAADHLACSLHPFGLGFSTPLPPGVIDYAAEVKTEPDAYLGLPADPADIAWRAPDRTLTQTEVVRLDPVADRVLVTPGDPWSAARDALITPLLGGGSAVVAAVRDPDQLAMIAQSERAIPAPPHPR